MAGSLRQVEAEAHAGRTVLSEFYYYAKHGRAFLHSEELSNGSVGDTSAIAATNPAGSGETAIFDMVRATPSARTMARVYDEFDTAPAAGDDAGIQNVLMDAAGGVADTGVLTTAVDPTYAASVSDAHVSEAVGSGEGAPATGGQVNAPVLALEPGRQAVFETEKLRSDGDSCPMLLRWFEVPAVYSENPPKPRLSEVTRA